MVQQVVGCVEGRQRGGRCTAQGKWENVKAAVNTIITGLAGVVCDDTT